MKRSPCLRVVHLDHPKDGMSSRRRIYRKATTSVNTGPTGPELQREQAPPNNPNSEGSFVVEMAYPISRVLL